MQGNCGWRQHHCWSTVTYDLRTGCNHLGNLPRRVHYCFSPHWVPRLVVPFADRLIVVASTIFE